MAGRLCLYSPGRFASPDSGSLSQRAGDDVDQRPVAWGGAEFCGVGLVAWDLVVRASNLVTATIGREENALETGPGVRVAAYLHRSESRMGVFLHGSAHGGVVFPAFAVGLNQDWMGTI